MRASARGAWTRPSRKSACRTPPAAAGPAVRRHGAAPRWRAAWPASRRCCCWTSRSGALDEVTRAEMQTLLRKVVADVGAAALLITDIDEALLLADRIVLLGGAPGGVLGEWAVDLAQPRADPARNGRAAPGNPVRLRGAAEPDARRPNRRYLFDPSSEQDTEPRNVPGTHVASRLVETDGAAERGRGGVVAVRLQCARAEPDAPVRIGICRSPTPRRCWWRNNGLFDKAGVKAEAHAAAQLGAGDRGLHLGTGQRGAPAVAHDRLGALRQSGAGQGGGLEPRRRLGPDGDAEINSVRTWAARPWRSRSGIPSITWCCNTCCARTACAPVSRKDGAPSAGEVNLIVMAPADMPPALAQKRIAGYIVAEPSTPRPRRWAWARCCVSPATSGATTPAAWCSCTSATWNSGRSGRRRWWTPSSGPTLDPRQPRGNRQAAVQGRHQPLHAARPAG